MIQNADKILSGHTNKQRCLIADALYYPRSPSSYQLVKVKLRLTERVDTSESVTVVENDCNGLQSEYDIMQRLYTHAASSSVRCTTDNCSTDRTDGSDMCASHITTTVPNVPVVRESYNPFITPIALFTTRDTERIRWSSHVIGKQDSDSDALTSSYSLSSIDYPYEAIVMERGSYTMEDYLSLPTTISSLSFRERLSLFDVFLSIVSLAHTVKDNDSSPIGIVLMDLKPENVVYCEYCNQWKAIDFDNAKSYSFSVSNNLSPPYASYEMARYVMSKQEEDVVRVPQASYAMDICALGWILYRLLHSELKTFWEVKAIREKDRECEGENESSGRESGRKRVRQGILHQLVTITDSEVQDVVCSTLQSVERSDSEEERMRNMLIELVCDMLCVDPLGRPSIEESMNKFCAWSLK